MEPIFFELPIDQEKKQICLVDLPTRRTGQNLEQIADWLAARYANDLEQTDLLILRPDVGSQVNNIAEFTGRIAILGYSQKRRGQRSICSTHLTLNISCPKT